MIILLVSNVHHVAQEAQWDESSPTNDGQAGEIWESDDFWSPNSQLAVQWETRQLDESSQRRSGRRKLGAAPLSQGCSEARAWYFLKEKEKREGEEEKETRRELR